MANPATPADRFKIRQALERARNCEPDAVDRNTSAILETAITNLWQRIQDAPDSYVLNGDEFALFNYFRVRYRDNRTAQLAVERFWNNYRGNSANSDGAIPVLTMPSWQLHLRNEDWERWTKPPSLAGIDGLNQHWKLLHVFSMCL
ncbi:hypothetical protein LV164_001274 [Aspergillus fumigatus]|nr:hypothetical protein KXX42_008924 [Aspergillus fumigatus]KAH1550877.1 hypothetical protein KXX57_009124 [Aspergillus fumigatus]KAH1982988.1 hypothetical protein KXW88_003940 [Aspergillus fumigatus]KAH2318412.1 hypothetical protein KXV47_007268 [Aspergillus fumigatus]KAH2763030.1 hypothetical protein KXV94_006108 [Aspergillus fumigatus]